jgi:hypothetical protein
LRKSFGKVLKESCRLIADRAAGTQVWVRCGSKGDLAAPKWDLRYASESGLKSDIVGGPFRAMKRLMHRSKQRRYSTTSSARASKFGGTVSPSAFAVLRLMASSYLVGA